MRTRPIFDKRRRRRAISPVLASVLMIAIALIMGVSLTGYAFSLLGSFTHVASMSEANGVCYTAAASASLSGPTPPAGDGVCVLTLTNNGGADGLIVGASTGFALDSSSPGLTSNAIGVPAGVQTTVYIDITNPSQPLPGQSVTGNLIMGVGILPFSAVVQS